jgi:predicted outer membrane protein
MVVSGNASALAAPDPAPYVQTASGPLGPADVELLTKVRTASLWEMPAGDMARQRAQNGRLREVGETIMVDHGRLDTAVRAVAGQLGVALPSEPTTDQQSWLNELRNATDGPEFDSIFVNRLRAAHGQVFSVIAQVRAGTRNSVIRDFATTSNQAVLRHITLLESSGLADFNSLPDPVLGGASLDLNPMDVAGAGAVALAEIVLLIVLLGLMNKRPKRAGRVNGGRRRAAEDTGFEELPADPFLTRT